MSASPMLEKRARKAGLRTASAAPPEEAAIMPLRHTGKWHGAYFYRGQPWFGPSNLIGARPIVRSVGGLSTRREQP